MKHGAKLLRVGKAAEGERFVTVNVCTFHRVKLPGASCSPEHRQLYVLVCWRTAPTEKTDMHW